MHQERHRERGDQHDSPRRHVRMRVADPQQRQAEPNDAAEREVMQLIWANDRLTAETVREKLARRLKESTVRTVLRRLEEKRYVSHTVDGRTYVYQATQPRGRVAAKAVQRIVDWFCNGSVEEVLVGMVDSAMLDQKQLRTLADQVAKAKAKGGK